MAKKSDSNPKVEISNDRGRRYASKKFFSEHWRKLSRPVKTKMVQILLFCGNAQNK